MSKDGYIELEGVVKEALPNAKFLVCLPIGDGDNKRNHTVLCTLSGKLRMNNIRILVGDKVVIEVSTHDLSKGRITWRK